jgi:SAM-dependent methyltransferase
VRVWTIFPLLLDAPPCPVCASDRLRSLHIYSNAKPTISAVLNFALMGCETCGIVFSHPLPSDDELDAYYSGESGWQHRISVDEAKIQRMLERKSAIYAGHLATIDRFIGQAKGDGGPPKAFDFGCGIGGWLKALKARGWETYGLEPGERARSIAAREHRMVTAIPDEPQFDLVIMNHALEHLRNPLAVVRALAAATKPGGHIYVSVPDFGGLPEHRDFGYVKSEHHIFSYTSSSLRSLFALAGFEMVAHSSESEWRRFAGDSRVPTRLAALGVQAGRELELAPDPLAEALASLRGYELTLRVDEVEKLIEPAKKTAHPDEKQREARRARRVSRRVAKPLRGLFSVWLHAAFRVRLQRLGAQKPPAG